MTYICKPKKVSIYVNTDRKTPTQIKSETGCDAIINGGLYNMATFTPVCHLKADGEVLAHDKYAYYGLAWTGTDFAMTTEYDTYDNYIACVCLVRNGSPATLFYNKDLGGSRPRTAMGVYEDGRVWLYADKVGKTPEELREIALAAGVQHAIMLDGGGSTQGISPVGTVTSSRIVHNFICVWDENDPKEETTMSKKVVIDPGHGVETAGKCSPDKSYYEHEFNLDVSKRLKAILERHGVDVTLTRTDKHDVTLANRVAIANRVRPDLFVSVHSNASGDGTNWTDPDGYGIYTSGAGDSAGRNKAAKAILARVKAADIALWGGGLHHNGYYVLKNTKDPAVLIEHGFHTNKAETALLKTSAYRDKLAEADAKGILDYLGITWKEKAVTDSDALYKVQVGAFSKKENAEKLKAELEKKGYQGYIVRA